MNISRRCFLALSSSLVAAPMSAWAARNTSKNTSNWISLGAGSVEPLFDGASAISFAAWVYPISLSPGGNDRESIISLLHSANDQFHYMLTYTSEPASAAGKQVVYARRVTADSAAYRNGSTAISTGVWSHVGAIARFNGTAPDVYLNGAKNNGSFSGVTSSGTALNTAGTRPASIGCTVTTGVTPTTTQRMIDGYIAHVALWAGDIGDVGQAQFFSRRSPMAIRPDLLKVYWPLDCGNPEVELVSRKPATINGSVPLVSAPKLFRP